MILRLVSRDGLDAAQHAAADGRPAPMPSSAQQHDAPQPELPHGAGELAQVLDVAADHQHEPARNRQRHADGMARGALAFLAGARVVEDGALAAQPRTPAARD